jgi:sugar O-acyltransferase (sialic acid O-acetyltransferase NeuD family)
MSERTRVIGLGAGGHAKVVLEALAAAGGFDVVGLLDPRRVLWGTTVLGVPVLGDDRELRRQYDQGVLNAFIGLGGASDSRPRRRLYEWARSEGVEVVSVVHPRALVSPSARQGAGATVLAGAIVAADAALGENVRVNHAAVVEHDCSVGDHVHLATGARLASGVIVDEGAHVGAGATVIQGLRIGAGAMVGAGAVVTRDVDPHVVVAGVPARALRRVEV